MIINTGGQRETNRKRKQYCRQQGMLCKGWCPLLLQLGYVLASRYRRQPWQLWRMWWYWRKLPYNQYRFITLTIPGYSNLHTRESHETFDNVRGRQRKKDSTSPTTPNTIVQVPCSVMEFMATVKVNRWLAETKMIKRNWPIPNNSRPKLPMRTSPASAMFWICG